MAYRFLADLLVAVHLIFVLFVVLGGVLVLWRRWVAVLHLPAAVWGVLIEISGGVCPLTPLEVRFRIVGGQAGYTGGFVEHYLIPILYPSELTRQQQIWMGVAVGLLNLFLYGVVLWKHLRGREGPPKPEV
jgi:hypothetical protein